MNTSLLILVFTELRDSYSIVIELCLLCAGTFFRYRCPGTQQLSYHPAVRVEDLPLIDRRTKDRIRKAIEERLQTAPHEYGKPLRKSLKGYWKLRVGDYRVVFKVTAVQITLNKKIYH